MLIIRVGNIMNAGFDQIFVFYNPTVYDVADIIGTYVYRMGLGKLEFSTGTGRGPLQLRDFHDPRSLFKLYCQKSNRKGIW